ncbi:hypothetical protein F4825DRAFT_102848 [Nemania diffusa]|nr:hypothetical protein F4825DRAFT_102848 [Nemania diffusa]
MQRIANEGLDQAKRMESTQEAGLAVTRFVKSCRESISAALAASATASIAWAGLCTILPLLENAINQRLEHAVLLAYVLDQAEWYSKLSRNFASHSPTVGNANTDAEGLRRDMQRKIVDIFKLLIKANMVSVCRYYYRNKLVVVLRDSIVWDNWPDMLKTIKETEQVFRDRSRLYYDNIIAQSIDSIDKHMEQQNRRRRYNDTLNLWSRYHTHRTETDPPALLAETGDWFFKHSDFVTWSQWTSEGILLVLKADPGCGKSVLAGEAIKRLEEEGSHTVAYFFFKKASGNNTAVDALTALLHQLLDKHEELLDRTVKGTTSISDYMERNSKALPERMVGILWDILEAATGPSEDHTINMVCILDAMDMCEGYADEFLRRLQSYLKRGNQRMKFLITSRWNASSFHKDKVLFKDIAPCRIIDVTNIEGNDDRKDEETRRRDESMRNSRRQDIDRVIEDNITSLTSAHNEKKHLRGLLKSDSQGTFLWVYLVFKYLRGEKDKPSTSARPWTSRVTRLPKDVNDAYGQLLTEAEKHWSNKEQLANMLKIVTAAKRPLTLQELRIACAIHEVEPVEDVQLEDIRSLHTLVSEALDVSNFRETIQQKCGFFLELDHAGRVAFFHETAREFLIEQQHTIRAASKAPAHESWKCSVNMAEAHSILARTCTRAVFLNLINITQLSNPVLAKNPLVEVVGWVKNAGFFAYAGEALDTHIMQWSHGERMSLAGDAMPFFLTKTRNVDVSVNLHTLCTMLLSASTSSPAQRAPYLSTSATVDDFPSLMAVGLAELAVHVISKDNPDYRKRLILLADCYFSRFGILGNLVDLQQAIDLFYEANKETIGYETEEELARRLDEFAESTFQQYRFTLNEKDIDRAISLKWDAVAFTADDSPSYNIRRTKALLFSCEKPSNLGQRWLLTNYEIG